MFMSKPDVKALYASLPYLEAYIAHTDQRVEADPKSAVGGMWDEIGSLQFDYLTANGLRPESTILDLGCGTLRAGRHFIRYLQPLHYTGFEISSKALEFAEYLVEDEGLAHKHPSLILNSSRTLRFEELGGTFDFLLAQSVFTHLLQEHIEECFAHVAKLMHNSSVFFFTFAESEKFERNNKKNFLQPFSFYEQLAKKYGFIIELRDNYDHPRNQRMVTLRLVFRQGPRAMMPTGYRDPYQPHGSNVASCRKF